MKKGCFKLLLLSIWLIFSSAAQSTQDPGIQQLVSQFVQAWNNHDTKALAALWIEDGDLLNPSGRWARGRKEIEEFLVDMHQGLLRHSRTQQTIENVRMLSPHLAFVDASVDLRLPSNILKEGIVHHVVYLLVKQNGQWRILSARPYPFVYFPIEPEMFEEHKHDQLNFKQ